MFKAAANAGSGGVKFSPYKKRAWSVVYVLIYNWGKLTFLKKGSMSSHPQPLFPRDTQAEKSAVVALDKQALVVDVDRLG